MPYYDLLNRENIYEILQETLREYFNSNILISDRYSCNERGAYLCFPRINAIIPVTYCKELREFIERDNRITYNLFKKVIMKLYLFGVFNFPNRLSNKILTILPAPENGMEIMIYPGNKKIKVIDFHNRVIDNVIKKGFINDWFVKEIEIRQNPIWDFVLPLDLTREGQYREPFLIGYGYPRLDRDSKKEVIQKVDMCIKQMQKKDKSEIRTSIYVSQLETKINNNIEQISKRILNIEIQNLISLICELVSLVINDERPIQLVFSHGDLQGGNIFVQSDNNKLWILDWETWGVRSEYYDKIIFYYNLRNSNNLIKNIMLMFKDKGKLLYLQSKENSYLRDATVIFLLEDILWQLEETKVLSGNHISNGLKHYMFPTIQRELLQLLNLKG